MYGTIHAMQSSPHTKLQTATKFAREKFPFKLRHLFDTNSENSVSQNTMSLRLGDLIKSPSTERSLSQRATRPDAEILIRAMWYVPDLPCHKAKVTQLLFHQGSTYHVLDQLYNSWLLQTAAELSVHSYTIGQSARQSTSKAIY